MLVKHFCVLSLSVGSGTPASLPHSSATVPPTEVTSDPALLFTATAITVFGVASLIHFFIKNYRRLHRSVEEAES